MGALKSRLRCKCGAVQGRFDTGLAYGRAVCYCKDCQAYARLLGQEREVLNRQAGTQIIATQPGSVQFTSGLDKLACVSLTQRGPLRWYASCCHTPIGNTPKNHNVAYLGLLRVCLNSTSAALEDALGPVKMVLNPQSARGKLKATPVATLVGTARIFVNILKARWRRPVKGNPFFSKDTGAPIQKPQTPAALQSENFKSVA